MIISWNDIRITRLNMWLWATWPSSWLIIASISSSLWSSSSVSNKTTLRTPQSPATNAFEWFDRCDPSITLISSTFTLVFSASEKIFSFRSSSSSSEKVKKIGRMTDGINSYTMITPAMLTQTSIGISAFPDFYMVHKRRGIKIANITSSKMIFLISSFMKVLAVVLLNPWCSSITKVSYIENGMSITSWIKIIVHANK